MSDFKNKREEILLTANNIINGDRQEQYGDPTASFERIATLWGAILPCEITAVDVARMLILLKVSRSMTSDDDDNWVDIAGYAGLGAECRPKKNITVNDTLNLTAVSLISTQCPSSLPGLTHRLVENCYSGKCLNGCGKTVTRAYA